MKRKREMQTMTLAETDELAKTYGSEDSRKGGDGENMRNLRQCEKNACMGLR
jgi:hypothetical protein